MDIFLALDDILKVDIRVNTLYLFFHPFHHPVDLLGHVEDEGLLRLVVLDALVDVQLDFGGPLAHQGVDVLDVFALLGLEGTLLAL